MKLPATSMVRSRGGMNRTLSFWEAAPRAARQKAGTQRPRAGLMVRRANFPPFGLGRGAKDTSCQHIRVQTDRGPFRSMRLLLAEDRERTPDPAMKDPLERIEAIRQGEQMLLKERKTLRKRMCGAEVEAR